MPQSRLIDVNTSAIKRRNEVSAGLDSRNYDKVFGALYSLNALLPDYPLEDGRQKYRITISDYLYKLFTQHKISITCMGCKKESDFKNIKVFELIPEMLEGLISQSKKDKVWLCPKCKKCNKLSESEMSETIPKEPYFIRVVPKPPKRSDGIDDRGDYDRKMIQWAWTFVQEWEASMAQFRDDNWQKSDQVFLPDNDIDGGEEND